MRNSLSCILSVFAALILIACSLRYVTDIWALSFIHSLQTHFGLIGCAMALMALIARRSLFGYFLLAAMLAITAHSVLMKREFTSEPFVAGMPIGASFRVMSFNILGDNYGNAKRIADAIATSKADVVYVMEAGPLLTYLDALAVVYPYRLGCGKGTPTCDLVMMSKYPFLTQQMVSLSDLRQDRFARVDIDMGGTVVQFAAAHLTKPYYDDYHQEELNRLGKLLETVKGPLVLAGDFNSSIIAPDMQRFLRSNGLKTAGYEPKTWPIEAGELGISIDHILARPPIAFKSIDRIDNMGSNHFGLIADLVIRK